MKSILRPAGLLLGCQLALVIPASAQTAPAAPAPAADSAAESAPVKLSAFRVSAPTDDGYVATDSLLGARIATPVADLPFPVEVVTSQLMQDFGMFEMDENVTFVSSFVGLSQGGQYQLRGFNQSYSLEDGFTRLGRYGTINVDRIELIKGPSAAVYGEATPGGMVNIVSKEPKMTPAESVTLYTGSNREANATVEATGPIGDKTSYLIDVGDNQRAYDVAFAELRNEELYATLRHNFDDSSSLTVKFDYYHNAFDAPQQILPYNYDSINKVYTGTLADNLADLSRTGPDAWHDRGIKSYTGIYEKQISSVWSLRLGANGYFATYNDFNNGVNTQYDIYAHTIGRGTPSLNLFNEDGDGVQTDVTAHYKLFGGEVENRELFTVDLNDYYKWDLQHSLGTAYTVAPYFNKTITLGLPFDYSLPAYNTNVYNSIGNDYKNRGIIDGVMFRHQTTLLDGKLLLFASAREDYVVINLHNLVPGALIVQHQNTQYFDPSLGFNYKVVPGVALYGSYSTGFDANIQGDTASSSHPINPATTGWGDDYGVKCNLLDNRLIFTLGGYYVSKEHTTVTVLQPDGTTISEPAGSQINRGVEFDFSYLATPDLLFGGGLGHVNSKITNDGDETEAVGRKPANVPDNNIGVYTHYRFPGELKGLYTNLSYSYISPTHPESATSGDTITKGVYTGSTFEWAVKIPSYYYFDWAWHYQLPPVGKINQKVSFIVKNLFNRFYVNSNDYVAEGRGYFVGYTLSH